MGHHRDHSQRTPLSTRLNRRASHAGVRRRKEGLAPGKDSGAKYSGQGLTHKAERRNYRYVEETRIDKAVDGEGNGVAWKVGGTPGGEAAL